MGPLGIQIGKAIFNQPPVHLGMVGTTDSSVAHRRADSPLLLVLFVAL